MIQVTQGRHHVVVWGASHAGRLDALQRLQPVTDRFQRLDQYGGRVLVEASTSRTRSRRRRTRRRRCPSRPRTQGMQRRLRARPHQPPGLPSRIPRRGAAISRLLPAQPPLRRLVGGHTVPSSAMVKTSRRPSALTTETICWSAVFGLGGAGAGARGPDLARNPLAVPWKHGAARRQAGQAWEPSSVGVLPPVAAIGL